MNITGPELGPWNINDEGKDIFYSIYDKLIGIEQQNFIIYTEKDRIINGYQA